MSQNQSMNIELMMHTDSSLYEQQSVRMQSQSPLALQKSKSQYDRFDGDMIGSIPYNYHGILLMLSYIVLFYDEKEEILGQLIFTGIQALMLINMTIMFKHGKRYKATFCIISISLLLDIGYIYFQQKLCFFAVLIISSTILSLDISIRVVKQCTLVVGKIKKLVITMTFLFFLCAYFATYFYQDNKFVKPFFQFFGDSSLTLLQVQTLDNWAIIGRQAALDQNSYPAYFFLCLFIFFLTYFYMNIMIGLILDTILEDSRTSSLALQENSDFYSSQEQILSDLLLLKPIDQIIIGEYYQIIVFVFSFGTVAFSIYTKFQDQDKVVDIVVGYTDDILYTIHFILLLIMKDKVYQLERCSFTMMVLHILAGPVSLMGTTFLDQSIGGLLNLLKLGTTPSIKGIFKGTFKIFPLLMPQFIQMCGLIMIIAGLFQINYFSIVGIDKSQYFTHFWDSVYTFIQIMTLDDWGAGILPLFQKKNIILPQVIIPLYVFLLNFIILNTLIAISCEYFKEIKSHNVDRDKNVQIQNNTMNSKDFYDYVQIKSEKLRLFQQQNILMLDSNMCSTSERQLIKVVQSLQQSQSIILSKLIYQGRTYHAKLVIPQKSLQQEEL